jgi:hypothetical protein
LRTITLTLGTVASLTAVIILAPWRMMPSRSTCEPIMNPGTSARKTSGTLNAAEPDEAGRLVGRVAEQDATLHGRVVGHDADTVASPAARSPR